MTPCILIADDHSMIRKGIKLILQTQLGATDVSEVSNCSGLMNELLKKKYTHLILDIILSDGTSLEVIPNIIKLYPDLKIMVFSMLNAEVYGEALKQYNIHRYLQKTTKEEDTIKFLRDFITDKEINIADSNQGSKSNPFSSLSARELEVLHYMLSGNRTKDIATILNLRMTTVSTLKNRIFEKTQTSNLKELIQIASLYNVNY
ncbi:MAG: response regulator transcription factor [Bacteroidetes bacterium]|nr:response regulator transcription factor [Bacteroidota bacterium]